MNWTEFCEKRKPLLEKMSVVKKEIKELENAYIEEHKQFSKGDYVLIRSNKRTTHAVVYDNNVDYNGRIVPVLLLMRKNRSSRPTFYHQHEFDESIVIEKCDE